MRSEGYVGLHAAPWVLDVPNKKWLQTHTYNRFCSEPQILSLLTDKNTRKLYLRLESDDSAKCHFTVENLKDRIQKGRETQSNHIPYEMCNPHNFSFAQWVRIKVLHE